MMRKLVGALLGAVLVWCSAAPAKAQQLAVYSVQPAASDNHATIKAGPGSVYKISAFNNSATINYIRLYDAGANFNGCNSASGLRWRGMIPGSTSGAGLSESWPADGMAFGLGIAICITSVYGDTDTTAATASALLVNIGYR